MPQLNLSPVRAAPEHLAAASVAATAAPRLDLARAASLARDGARQAVCDEMDAHDRYRPDEVGKDWLHVGIVQQLRTNLHLPGAPRFRVHDAYRDCEIGNLVCDYPHLVDVAVLYPVPGTAGMPDHAPAVGLIEIRKSLADLADAAARLGRFAAGPAEEPPLQWLLLLLLLEGESPEEVLVRQSEAAAIAARFGLLPLGEAAPERAAPVSVAAAEARWFDIACYGRAIGF